MSPWLCTGLKLRSVFLSWAGGRLLMQQNFIYTEQILPDTPYPAVANQWPRNDMSWNDMMEHFSSKLEYSARRTGCGTAWLTYLSFEHLPAPKLHGLKCRNCLCSSMQLNRNSIPGVNYHICWSLRLMRQLHPGESLSTGLGVPGMTSLEMVPD